MFIRPSTDLGFGRVWAALATSIGLVIAVGCAGRSNELVGYQVLPAPDVSGFTLTDVAHGGAPFPLKARPGTLLVAFLGFTNCPDACPTAMAEISTAVDRLGDEGRRIDVAMITVDPERDVGPEFAEFVQNFVDDSSALRTDDPTELQSIVTAFGATAVADQGHDGDMDVGHTDYTYAVDETGTVVLTWTAAMTVDDIVNDLRILLD